MSNPQVVLVMFRPNGETRSFSINRDVTVIGRRQECDLRIPLSEVSRKHCRVVCENGAVRAEDLGSSNGTFHNGERVQEAELAPGDKLKIGPLTFVVQIDGVPDESEISPVAAKSTAPVVARGTPSEDALNPTAQSDAADALASPIAATQSKRPKVEPEAEEFDPMSILSSPDGSGEFDIIEGIDEDDDEDEKIEMG